ncbi:MAG: glycosyltransferase family 39 protein [Planctomycetales bacterium]|nr:glycosyltransferase family 39 protein [Planctomycetales bacterium]
MTEEMVSTKETTWLLIVVALVGLLLFYWSSSTGLQTDELLFLRAIELGPVDGLLAPGSSHPPLFRWLVGLCLDGNCPDWVLRTPSIILSLATIIVWWAIGKRLISNAFTTACMLPILAFMPSWLDVAYQLTPYAALTFFVTLHTWCWLCFVDSWLNRRRLDKYVAAITLTTTACMWTHFYGLNVLVADQILWLIIWKRDRSIVKRWMASGFLSGLAFLPLIPIVAYYAGLEKAHAIIRIEEFSTFFIQQSCVLFSDLTFSIPSLGILLFVWYALIASTLLKAWLKLPGPKEIYSSTVAAETLPNLVREWSAVVLACIFLAGIPAAQAHSWLGQKAMWSRYIVPASWSHWPLFVAWVSHRWNRLTLRFVMLTVIGLILFTLWSVRHLRPDWTFENEPIQLTLNSHVKSNDAFFVQAMDIWEGDANFDRLWFDRYSPVKMKVIEGEQKGRFEIGEQGIDLTSIDSSVDRIWICSNLFDESFLRSQENQQWKLSFLSLSVPRRPLALFTRRSTAKQKLVNLD